MAAFEMYNHGFRALFWQYKGQDVCMETGKLYETDDPDFAKAASEQQYIEVIEKEKPVDQMNKKELIAKAARMKIKTSGMNKSDLLAAIKEVKKDAC